MRYRHILVTYRCYTWLQRHVCVFLCAYVFCFTLEDWFHLERWFPSGAKPSSSHSNFTFMVSELPGKHMGAQQGLSPARSHWALLWNCILGKQKQLERWEFTYHLLFNTHEAKGPQKVMQNVKLLKQNQWEFDSDSSADFCIKKTSKEVRSHTRGGFGSKG